MNKFKNHQSIRLMKSKKRQKKFILFIFFSYEKVLNENNSLHTAKTIQQNNIPKKTMEENSKVFAQYFHENIFLYCNLDVPIWFKTWKYPQHLKRNQQFRKIGADQLLFYQMYLRYMKDIFKTKCRLSKYCLNISEGFEKF